MEPKEKAPEVSGELRELLHASQRSVQVLRQEVEERDAEIEALSRTLADGNDGLVELERLLSAADNDRDALRDMLATEKAAREEAERERDALKAKLAEAEGRALAMREPLQQFAAWLSRFRPYMRITNDGSIDAISAWDQLEIAHNAACAALAEWKKVKP